MPYKSLTQFINDLEKENELIRIKEFVNPVLEITEITDRVSKSKDGGKALLFENTGTDFPVLINAYGSYKRICMALGVDNIDEIGIEFEQLFKKLIQPKDNLFDKLKLLSRLSKLSSLMPKVIGGKGACQEIIIKNPALTKFPVLKCWPEDGDKFLTLPIVHTKHPVTGIRNVGMYRMQVFEKDLTAMHWHCHKGGAQHYNEYKKLSKIMPVAVALGGDPVYAYSASAPLPENIDEYLLAGFLRKKRVKLVKCITQDIEVPADADIVIEGYINPGEDLIREGPFGDHTGYYSLPDWYPKFHITCITHKKNAIYPATIVGIPPQEDAWISKATERIFLTLLKMTLLPEIKDIALPVAGVAHNLAIVKIENNFPGHALKVMNALWGAGQMMFNKILIVVDGDIDIHNYKELAQVMSKNVNPVRDIHFSKGPLDILDHSSSKTGFGGKLCIDATSEISQGNDERDSRQSNYAKASLDKSAVPQRRDFRSAPIGSRQGVHHVIARSKATKQSVGNNSRSHSNIDKTIIKDKFPEIHKINDELLNQHISLVFISLKKNKKNHIQLISNEIFQLKGFDKVKAIIFVDTGINVFDIFTTVWYCTNNIDPERDCKILPEIKDLSAIANLSRHSCREAKADEISHIVIDGTRKTKKEDNFQRQWPNIIVSDDKTINNIDNIWNKLGLCELIKSPSLKFKQLVLNDGAAVKE